MTLYLGKSGARPGRLPGRRQAPRDPPAPGEHGHLLRRPSGRGFGAVSENEAGHDHPLCKTWRGVRRCDRDGYRHLACRHAPATPTCDSCVPLVVLPFCINGSFLAVGRLARQHHRRHCKKIQTTPSRASHRNHTARGRLASTACADTQKASCISRCPAMNCRAATYARGLSNRQFFQMYACNSQRSGWPQAQSFCERRQPIWK